MPKYEVSYEITVSVEANSQTEASEKAFNGIYFADGLQVEWLEETEAN